MKPKRRGFAAAAALLGLLAGLLLAEALLRFGAAAYRRYRLPPPAGPAGAYRILCAGDSFTFGFGAPQGESYPDHLQRLLDRDYGRGRFVVLNQGLPGKNPTQIADNLRLQLVRERPRLLLALVGMNTYHMADSSYARFAPLSETGWPGAAARADLIASESRLYRLAKVGGRELRRRWRMRRLRIAPQARELARQGAELMRRALRRPEPERTNWLAEAEAVLRRSIALEFNDPWPHFMLGEVLQYRAGEHTAGTAEWKLAVELDPDGELGRHKVTMKMYGRMDYKAADKALFFDLDRIRAVAAQEGVTLVLQGYPGGTVPALNDYALSRSARFVDHAAVFDALESRGKPYARYTAFDDLHLNGAGNKIMAETLLRELADVWRSAAPPAAR